MHRGRGSPFAIAPLETFMSLDGDHRPHVLYVVLFPSPSRSARGWWLAACILAMAAAASMLLQVQMSHVLVVCKCKGSRVQGYVVRIYPVFL
jgi:hypothetical protein